MIALRISHDWWSEGYFDLIFKTYINDMIYILRLIFSSDSCTDRIIMQNVIYINRPCNKSTQLKWTFIVLTHFIPRVIAKNLTAFDFNDFWTQFKVKTDEYLVCLKLPFLSYERFEITRYFLKTPLFSQSFEINVKKWPTGLHRCWWQFSGVVDRISILVTSFGC